MSTIQVINAKHPSSASNNLVLDSSGNATFAGTAAMASSFLRNRIINGDMRIDQRNAGASVTVNNSGNNFGVDRFFATGQSSDGVFTVQSSSVAPEGFRNSLIATVTTADASIGASQIYVIGQRIEGFNIADLGWGAAGAQTVTLSFWVRSSLAGTFGGSITNETGYSYPFTYTISAANTFEKKTVTITGATAGTWLTTNGTGACVVFTLGSGTTFTGAAGAWSANVFYGATGQTQLIGTNGATFYLTGVQLEVGSVATPFERRQYGTELMLCQRYFERIDAAFQTCSNAGFANSYASTFFYKVEKRAAGTITAYSGTNLTGAGGNLLWYPGTVTAVPNIEANSTGSVCLARTGTNTYNLVTGSLSVNSEL